MSIGALSRKKKLENKLFTQRESVDYEGKEMKAATDVMGQFRVFFFYQVNSSLKKVQHLFDANIKD